MRAIFLAFAAFFMAIAFAAQAPAAPLSYDCQARMTRVETIAPPAPGDANAWQCPIPTAKPVTATHWQRNSLEYCRLTLNAYDGARAAARRLTKANKPRQWIVLMDADETVLDNSLFDRERDACGGEVRDAQWESWVAARLARDVPGAAAFTRDVHRLGGLIAIVTNRRASDDAITRADLARNGIWFDYEIGMTDTPDKTMRWRDAVAALKARFGGHPRPIMWVGDQVTDLAILDKTGKILRAMTQKDSGAGIGANLFLLPNPMYGNWQNNPAN